ncbi:MAG: putative Ig domain-containing protein, partial [Planctomycetia bacterium]|nr:putative Ig domain-containing protein [Planctomycetia bacterium]
MVRRNDGQSVLFAANLEERRLGAALSLHDIYTTHAQPDPVWGEVEPDWVGVSPLGNYLVVGWQRDGTAGASGIETFDLNTGAFVGRVNEGHQHGDLGVLPDGQTEYYMTFEVYGSPADRGRPAIGLRLLPGNAVVSEPTYLQSIDWGNGEHISTRGPNGVALVTSGTDPSNGWTAYEGEVWLQYTDGSVLRLAHHRSTSSDYWVQPRASISRDGRYVVFASDWGRATDGRGDPYLIDLGVAQPPPDVNAPPVLDPIGNKSVNAGQALTFTALASDPDGHALTFSLDVGAPTGAAIDAATGLFTWTPSADQGAGDYAVTVRVTDNGSPSLSDFETISITVVQPPRVTISDVTVMEGDSGLRYAYFVVTLSSAGNQRVSIEYATAGGSATPGSDFRSRSGRLTFNAGETRKTITIPVIGDRRDEPDESFVVNLTNPTGVGIADSQGLGTIVDNDPLPVLSINRVRVQEGDAGTVLATFTVRLSAASGEQVTLDYSTADGSAVAGEDYEA